MSTKEEDNSEPTNQPPNIFDKNRQEQTNGNIPDSSAKRNIGLNGETQRNDQKDKLGNMHIAGNEKTGYGANDPDSKESIAQGPGFEFEGSYDEMDGTVNGVRSSEQEFGSKEVKKVNKEEDHERI